MDFGGLFRDLEFAYPWAFVLLALLPILFYLWRKQGDSYFKSANASALPSGGSFRINLLKSVKYLRTAALISLIIALAGPQYHYQIKKSSSEGIDIMLCIDISGSMLAKDFDPNRLEVAKEVAAHFIEKRPFDRIGLVLFSGESFTQTPLTLDHNLLIQSIKSTEVGIIRDGTAIGMGLANSVNRLSSNEIKSKVVILLTDGVNNSGYIDPMSATELAQKYGVKVYTIGVGSTGDAPMPMSRRSDGTFIYSMVKVEIDEILLKKIAAETGGRYFRATTKEMLSYIYSEIDKMEKTEVEIEILSDIQEKFRVFLLLAFLFILLDLLITFVLAKRIRI